MSQDMLGVLFALALIAGVVIAVSVAMTWNRELTWRLRICLDTAGVVLAAALFAPMLVAALASSATYGRWSAVGLFGLLLGFTVVSLVVTIIMWSVDRRRQRHPQPQAV